MTTVLALQFPTGRYHATPWDRTVNEAAVEWPPSPWRLLRALYSTWRTRAPELTGEVVSGLLDSLQTPPSFRLPPRGEAHTRHYYPDQADGKDKVFDPFAVLDPTAEVLIRWDVVLAPEHRAALERLCRLLPYVGRADSLCVARVLDDDPAQGPWLEPGAPGSLAQAATRVLAPLTPLSIDALTLTSAQMRSAGRTTPPGARWLNYRIPGPVAPTTTKPARAHRPPPTAVRLRFDAPALPTQHQAVTYGHVLHRAVLRWHDAPSATLSGKDDGGARQDGHRHAHYLCLDSDDDRLLDTGVVWAPEGLTDSAVAALGAGRKLTFGTPGFRPVRVAVEAVGPVYEVAPELTATPASGTWVSVTPFAPYRHQAKRELDRYLHQELSRELATRQLPTLVEVQVVPGAWLDFRRQRRPQDIPARVFGLQIQLAEAVVGPIVLGALSHFGLGRFRAA